MRGIPDSGRPLERSLLVTGDRIQVSQTGKCSPCGMRRMPVLLSGEHEHRRPHLFLPVRGS